MVALKHAWISASVLVLAPVFQVFNAPLAAQSAQTTSALEVAQDTKKQDATDHRPVVLEGEVQVLYEDHADHAVLVHVLQTPNGRVPVRFRGKAPDLRTGARVRIRGDQASDGSLEALASDVTPLGAGMEALAPGIDPAWVFGEKNVLVIFFKFTGQSDPYTPASTAPVNDEVKSFYAENSYGQSSLNMTLGGWYTIAWPSDFGCDFQLWGSLADNGAATAGYDLASYDRIVYAFPYQRACGFLGVAQVAGSRAWINGSYDRHVVAHELGHTFGLHHSRALVCDAAGCDDTSIANVYGDTVDTMGGADFGHFNAYQKERIGWLNYNASPPIQTVDANGQYNIEPMSTTPGSVPKALKIFTTDGATDRFIYVEQRVGTGVDSGLAAGVTLHTGSPTDATSSRHIDLDRGTTADDRVLDPGQSFTFSDASPRVTIQTVSSGSTGAVVSVSIEAGCFFSASPTSAFFPGYGGTGRVDVTAPADCTWTASSSLAWIRITSAAAGTGTGYIEYTVDPNPANSSRNGSFTVAGRTVAISQSNAAAGFISPTEGTSVLAPTWTFQWTDVPAANSFRLRVGTTPGGSDLVNTNSLGKVTSYAVSNLPVSQTLYATIRTCWVNNCSTETSASISFKTMDRLTGVNLLGAQTPNPVSAGGTAQYGANAQGSVQVAYTGAMGNCSVNLSATGLPSGATATFAPAATISQAANAYSLLTISTTSATPAGSYPITITAGESASCGGQARTASATLVVTGGATSTVLSVTPASGTYGSTVALSATLTAGGAAAVGKTITFTVNGNAAGSAVTDASGVATVSAASLGGIGAGAYPAGVAGSFAGDGTHNASIGTGALTVNPKALTATITASNKVYDGTPAATLTGCTLAGVVGSDVVSCAGSGSATFDTAAAGTGKTVTTTGLALSGASAANYVLSSTTATATATITARPVTVTAGVKAKQYGDADPTLTYTVTNGSLVTGDSFTGALTRAAGEAVGIYAILQGTLTLSSDYAVTYVGASLTIGARAITVTAAAQSKQYGDADPALTYVVTNGSLLAGESFTGSLGRAAGEGVGIYAIVQGTLALSANYALEYVGADLTIGPRVVTVAADAKSKGYGDADPAFTHQVTNGSLVAGDSVTGTLTRAPGESVGVYAILQGTLALNGNYSLTYVGATLTIEAKPVTSVAISADRTAPQPPNTPIVFSAAATGGATPAEYKFWIYDGASWTVGREWSTSTTFTWTPAAENRNYRVYVFARSAGNTADAAEKIAYVAFPIVGLINDVTLTPSAAAPQPAGTSVTFTAAASGGTAPHQFKWWLYDGATWTIGQNWSTSTTFAWTPATANRNYRVYVFARSAGNTADAAEKMAYVAFPIVDVITNVTLTANLTAPQPAGTSVIFTAAATGGTAPHQFKWWLYDGATWTIGQNWSTTATFTWAPTSANRNYRVYVFARSAGNTADAAEKLAYVAFPIVSVISSVTLTANLAPPQPLGSSVTFTAAASGGTAPYQFKFWLYDGATWTIGQNWSTAATFTWTPVTANRNYRVYVFARSAGNTADAAEKLVYVAFPIVDVITNVTLTANLAAPQPTGTSVVFTAAATGGTAPYQFKFWIYDGATWTIGQNWSTSTTFTWTPATASSNYRVYVFARSAGNSADAAEKYAYVAFPIMTP